MGPPPCGQRATLGEMQSSAADYDDFVTDQLPGLLAAAELLTTQTRAAESLVVDTLVAACQSWPSLRLSRDPAAEVQQLLFSRYARLARAELRAQRRSTDHDALELDEHAAIRHRLEEADAVWQAVLDLPIRERTALVSAWWERHRSPVPSEAGSLRLRAVARLARQDTRVRAVRRIAATVGVSPGDEICDGRGDGGRWLEGEITAAFDAHHRHDVDTAPIQQVLHAQTDQLRPTPHRVRRAVAGLGAAGAVGLALVALQLWPGGNVNDSAAGSTPPVVAPAPAGAMLVGFRDVVVAVPSSWEHETSCQMRVSDNVVYGDAPSRRNCVTRRSESSVTFEALPPYPLPYRMPPVPTRLVGGHRVFALDVDKDASAYEQVVVVPVSSVKMTIHSPDLAIIGEIVASMRDVPEGYAVVPSCQGHRVRDAVADLAAVDLDQSIAHASGISQRYGSPPVTFQSPAPGTIVLRGTNIRLGLPSF